MNIRSFLPGFRFLRNFRKKTVVHFFHIGKTGGTSIKNALYSNPFINEKYIIHSHGHSFHLQSVSPGEKYFFFVRDPIDRFVSGFYSRKRKGMPRIFKEWTVGEKEAFETFSTPNELALALSNTNATIREKAYKAMSSIGHVKTSYWEWFENEEYFLHRIQDVLFVGTQENLSEDFIRLKKILELPEDMVLPTDPIHTHRNPEHIDKYLEPEAIDNLRKWYSREYDFLELLRSRKLL